GAPLSKPRQARIGRRGTTVLKLKLTRAGRATLAASPVGQLPVLVDTTVIDRGGATREAAVQAVLVGAPERRRRSPLRNRRGHGPASGELLELEVEELERAAVVERHAVLAGAVRGDEPFGDDVPVTPVRDSHDVAHCDAACRRLHDLLPRQAQDATSAAAPVSTASPRSVLAVSTI